MTLFIGTWIVPLLVTVAAFGYAAWLTRADGPSYGGYAAIGDAIIGAFRFGTALIITLFAWFIWAMVR